MGVLEIIVVGIGLSMDAFAVSICKGLKMNGFSAKKALIISAFFGGFQALMPLIGYFVGGLFEQYITAVDHWIAFILLAFLGIKTIIESVKDSDVDVGDRTDEPLDLKELLLMAIATSIDALAVGITMAFLDLTVGIWGAIAIIGGLTAAICFAGSFIGYKFGSRFKKVAEIIGGSVLVLVGLKILLEHLGILFF